MAVISLYVKVGKGTRKMTLYTLHVYKSGSVVVVAVVVEVLPGGGGGGGISSRQIGYR